MNIKFNFFMNCIRPFISSVLLFYSCASSKIEAQKNFEKGPKVEIKSCLGDGICNVQFVKNKSVVLAYDEFDNSYLKSEDSDLSYLKYEYLQSYDAKIMDASYREEIIIPINKDILSKSEIINLSAYPAYFGRFCFCKGETGYYLIKEGTLKIIKITDNEYLLDLNFKISEVPQVVKQMTLRVKK